MRWLWLSQWVSLEKNKFPPLHPCSVRSFRNRKKEWNSPGKREITQNFYGNPNFPASADFSIPVSSCCKGLCKILRSLAVQSLLLLCWKWWGVQEAAAPFLPEQELWLDSHQMSAHNKARGHTLGAQWAQRAPEGKMITACQLQTLPWLIHILRLASLLPSIPSHLIKWPIDSLDPCDTKMIVLVRAV